MNTSRKLAIGAVVSLLTATAADDRLVRHRNLGKAFYENPTTQVQAVEEFRKALELAPSSARERLNYGLALLRAGKTAEGIVEIEKVQKQDPKIPHTWFNLGIQYKKQGDADRAIAQLEQMIKLAPDDPIAQYNLGASYKLAGRNAEALKHFETAAKLDPNLAGPHFQLFNAYRLAGRQPDASRELQIFQRIKKEQEGAAIPEDMEWNMYAEIYEIIEPVPLPPVRRSM
jgi:tetratricopeptide (TPR) repeat protein